METLDSALELVFKDCFFASVDLKKAYYSVLVSPQFRKYLRLEWAGQLYRYVVLPNGLSSAPKTFTRIVKVVACELRKTGFKASFILDDSLLLSNSYQGCRRNSEATIAMLCNADFDINYAKSALLPSHRVQFLGFTIDSQELKVFLPEDKVSRMKRLCSGVRGLW